MESLGLGMLAAGITKTQKTAKRKKAPAVPAAGGATAASVAERARAPATRANRIPAKGKGRKKPEEYSDRPVSDIALLRLLLDQGGPSAQAEATPTGGNECTADDAMVAAFANLAQKKSKRPADMDDPVQVAEHDQRQGKTPRVKGKQVLLCPRHNCLHAPLCCYVRASFSPHTRFSCQEFLRNWYEYEENYLHMHEYCVLR